MVRRINSTDDRLWYHTDMRSENFTQIVVIPATHCSEQDIDSINAYVREHVPLAHDLKLIGNVETMHYAKDGESRIDTMLLIHNDDILKFAHKRFGFDIPMRWLEDVLGNDMERGMQTYASAFLADYAPTWKFSETEWHEYPCYEGGWQ